MKKYMSVKEYAAASGMSFQAVYKSIKAGKIETEKITSDGKSVIAIVLDDDRARPSSVLDPVPLDVTDADPDHQEDAAAVRDPSDPAEHLARNDEIKALEKAVDALTRQLEEKDRQIADLMKLLHNQQELQAHSQMLLTQQTTEEKEDPAIVEPPPKEKPKRRSFWEWWTSPV